MTDNPIKTITGTARTESVQSMNGSPVKVRRRNKLQYFGGKHIDRNGNVHEINAQSPTSPYAYKYFARLDDKPVHWDQIQGLDPNIRMTKGFYMIKYTPCHCTEYKKGRPYKIGQDLIRWDIRVSGPEEWHKLCETVPELGWLARNSTLTDEMFRIAHDHMGMSFFFGVDWVRYEAKIRAQLENQEERPFVSRKISLADWDDIAEEENKKSVTTRNWTDVLKEINDAERDPAVQEEMLRETGETYGRSRKIMRDPVTGRFLSKAQRQALSVQKEG